MKKILLILFAFGAMNFAFAQEGNTKKDSLSKKPPKMDRLVFDFNKNFWLNTPDSVAVDFFSRGFNFYLMYDLPIGAGNFSVAFGLGVSSQNIFSDAALQWQNSTTGLAQMATDDSSASVFIPIESLAGPDYSYKKNKISTTYLDVPLELRLRTNENGNGKRFKIAIGGKVGYLVNAHSKIIDDDGKKKSFIFPNVNPFRYGFVARLGYGKFNISLFHSISGFFEDGKGVEMLPHAIGIGISI